MAHKFYKVLCFIYLTITISCSAPTHETKKPNILFIMSDDHTSQAFGIYKSRLAKLDPTPNLDKIANEGLIFDNAFVNNSICVPSRAAI